MAAREGTEHNRKNTKEKFNKVNEEKRKLLRIE